MAAKQRSELVDRRREALIVSGEYAQFVDGVNPILTSEVGSDE